MITLRFKKQAIKDCSHSGSCDDDVSFWTHSACIANQLDAMDKEEIRRYLKNSGAWDEEELSDNDDNRLRLVWIAAGNCKENKTCLFQDCV